MIAKKVTPEAARLLWSNVGGEMQSEQRLLDVLSPLYADLGGNPADLVRITPSYGGWLNALRFQVLRADGAATWVCRADLDTANRRKLMNALRDFSRTQVQHIGGLPHSLEHGTDALTGRH